MSETRHLGEVTLAALIALVTALPACAPLAWLLGLAWRGRLVIGADGFTSYWPLRRPAFVSFGEVAEIDGRRRRLDRFALKTSVRLRSGGTLWLLARDAPTVDAQRGAESRELHQHLTETFARSLARDTGETQLDDLLARRQRPVVEWLTSLDALGRAEGARYRVATPTTERLLGALENPALSTASRTAAAVALWRRGDDDCRSAVRVATHRCAQPDLRRALLDLAQADDDEAFADVLASVDLPARRRVP